MNRTLPASKSLSGLNARPDGVEEIKAEQSRSLLELISTDNLEKKLIDKNDAELESPTQPFTSAQQSPSKTDLIKQQSTQSTASLSEMFEDARSEIAASEALDSPDACEMYKVSPIEEERLVNKQVDLVRRQESIGRRGKGDMVLTQRLSSGHVRRVSDLEVPPLEMLYGPHLKFHPEEGYHLTRRRDS